MKNLLKYVIILPMLSTIGCSSDKDVEPEPTYYIAPGPIELDKWTVDLSAAYPTDTLTILQGNGGYKLLTPKYMWGANQNSFIQYSCNRTLFATQIVGNKIIVNRSPKAEPGLKEGYFLFLDDTMQGRIVFIREPMPEGWGRILRATFYDMIIDGVKGWEVPHAVFDSVFIAANYPDYWITE